MTPPVGERIFSIVKDGALEAQKPNKAGYPAFTPFPVEALERIKPVNVHSHNDVSTEEQVKHCFNPEPETLADRPTSTRSMTIRPPHCSRP